MGQRTASYNHKQVAVIYGGRTIEGFAENGITVARDNDSFTDMSGADGEVMVSHSNDKRGTVTLNLMQSSASNLILSGFLKVQEAAGKVIPLPLIIRDNNGLSVLAAGNAWVVKPADAGFAKTGQDRSWTIRCADLEMLDAGIA
jgi:hypothetical protein